MAIKQTRIFVPPLRPFDNSFWVETLVGSILVPLVAQTEWFWFSRYKSTRDDSGDCDINAIPNEFGIDQNGNSVGANGFFRSLRFRYQVSDERVDTFEFQLRCLIEAHHCVISDFRGYPLIDDLGGDRFVGGERSQQRRQDRAALMVRYLNDICQIFIHCLEGPDENGNFHFERSDSNQNPQGSIFESAHHLFCNITNVPLNVLISPNGIGTYWSPPVGAEGANLTAIPIRF